MSWRHAACKCCGKEPGDCSCVPGALKIADSWDSNAHDHCSIEIGVGPFDHSIAVDANCCGIAYAVQIMCFCDGSGVTSLDSVGNPPVVLDLEESLFRNVTGFDVVFEPHGQFGHAVQPNSLVEGGECTVYKTQDGEIFTAQAALDWHQTPNLNVTCPREITSLVGAVPIAPLPVVQFTHGADLLATLFSGQTYDNVNGFVNHSTLDSVTSRSMLATAKDFDCVIDDDETGHVRSGTFSVNYQSAPGAIAIDWALTWHDDNQINAGFRRVEDLSMQGSISLIASDGVFCDGENANVAPPPINSPSLDGKRRMTLDFGRARSIDEARRLRDEFWRSMRIDERRRRSMRRRNTMGGECRFCGGSLLPLGCGGTCGSCGSEQGGCG